jgi:hypothetical protein
MTSASMSLNEYASIGAISPPKEWPASAMRWKVGGRPDATP